MLRLLVPYLQTVVPYWGDHTHASVALRTLRLALVLTGALTPVYGVVYAAAYPDAFDPAWVRVTLTVVPLAGLAASYIADGARRVARPALLVVASVQVVWYSVLIWANHLDGGYVMGHMFVVLAVGVVVSLAWFEPRPFAAVLLFAFAVSLVAVLCADPAQAELSPLVVLVVLASGEIVIYLAFSGRLLIARTLAEREARLATAEKLAQTGAWTFDPVAGVRTWSEGMYEIMGVEARPGEPPSVFESIHADDYAAAVAGREQFRETGDTARTRFRIVRPDGEVRWLQTVIVATRAPTGEPRMFRGVSLDVTAQVAYEAELREARDVAEAAAAAQASFLANMSHEVRTPLTAMIGFAEILCEDSGPSPAELATPIASSGYRLLATLDSILDLAAMDAGGIELELGTVDVKAALGRSIASASTTAQAKGLDFACSLPATPLAACADAEALPRVVDALLSNALTYTSTGRIALSVRSTATHVFVDVADTGVGIEAAFVADGLFEPFRQASSGWRRTYEGAGLGLAIASRLVEAMGGTLDVESEVGVGSRFTVSLPRATAPVDVGRIWERSEAPAVSAPEPQAA